MSCATATEQPIQTLQLNTRLSNKSWVCSTSIFSTRTVYLNHTFQLGDELSDEEDPFAEVCH